MKKLLIAIMLFVSMLLTSCAATAPSEIYIGKNGNWWRENEDLGISAQGPKGDQGEKGEPGDTGPKGDQGEKGDTGATGPKGDQGEKGDTGATGPKGDQGEKGDTGATGPKGDRGEKGEPGDTPYIGENGNWWIGNTDTGVKASEENMERVGSDGLLFRTTIRGGVAGYEVYDYIGSDTDIVIPNAIFDQPVVSIAENALPDMITSLSIGSHVEWFPSFRNYTNLVSFDFNHAPVDTMASEMFRNCKNLGEIKNYGNIKHISDYAFYGTQIVNFDFSAIESIGTNAFNSCALGDEALWSAVSHGFLYLPQTVLTIGENAFDSRYVVYYAGENPYFNTTSRVGNVKCSEDGYYYLDNGTTLSVLNYFGEASRIVIPSVIGEKTVVALEPFAFYGNYTIERVEIPHSVQSVGESSFFLCKKLHSVFVPDSVETFGKFDDGCIAYQTIGFECMTFFFEATAFDYTGGVTSPSSLGIVKYMIGISSESIEDDDAIVYWKNDASYEIVTVKNRPGIVTIPATYQGLPISRINTYALYRDTLTTGIIIEDEIPKIATKAFYDSSALKSVVVPKSVVIVNNYGFYDLTNCTIVIRQEAIPEDWDSSWYYQIKEYVLGSETEIAGEYMYEVVNGKLYLKKYLGVITPDTPVFIPEKIDGIPVYGVRSQCFEGSNAYSYSANYIFVIPEGIQVMESQAIYLYGYGYCTLYMQFSSSAEIPTAWSDNWLYSSYYGSVFSSSSTKKYYRGEWELKDGILTKV